MKKLILCVCLMALAILTAACGAPGSAKGDGDVSPSWADGTYVLTVYVSEDTCTPERKGDLDVLPAFFSRTSFHEETGESELLFYALEEDLQFRGTLYPLDYEGRGVYLADAEDVTEEIESLRYDGEFSDFEGDVFHGAMLTMQIRGKYCASGTPGVRQFLLIGVSYRQ